MKDVFKEYSISGFDNHVYINIEYLLFVYQKSIGTAIQGIAYENAVHYFCFQLSLLGNS